MKLNRVESEFLPHLTTITLVFEGLKPVNLYFNDDSNAETVIQELQIAIGSIKARMLSPNHFESQEM